MTTWADLGSRTWGSLMTWAHPDGGKPIFSRTIGISNANVMVELAFGADLTQPPSTWSFVDVTADLMVDPAPVIGFGRPDEAQQAQPATLKLQLRNTAGDYTPRRAMSQYWPNVRKDTPIRFTLNPGTGAAERFTGLVDAFVPSWDTSGKIRVVNVSASGLLRKLGQGDSPLRSALERAMVASAPLVYWPCEDGKTATQAASALAGGVPMTARGTPVFAGVDGPAGSDKLVDLSLGASLAGQVPVSSATSWRVECVANAGPLASGNFASILQWTTRGGIALWELDTTAVGEGGMYIQYIAADGSLAAFNSGVDVADGSWHHYRVDGAQSGGSMTIKVYLDGALVISQTVALTFGAVTGAIANPSRGSVAGSPALGHIAVWAPWASTVDTPDAFRGHTGEQAHVRFARLCGEEGIPVTVTGSASEPMGPQGIAKLLDLLRECEATDGGVMGDGRGFGLWLTTRSARYNLAAAITADIPSGQVMPPFQPAEDDFKAANDVTAKRSNGSSARVSDETDVQAHGRTPTEIPVNTATDTPLASIASWALHVATTDAERYPVINLSMGASPELLDDWLAAGVLARMLITGKPDTASDGPADVVIEGYTETFDPFDIQITVNAAPYEPWRVGVIEDGGEQNVPLRLDMASSTLHAGVNATTTTLQVDTMDGPLLATKAAYPADFPADIEIGGEQIRVTDLTGSSNPQTLTVTRSVNGVVKAHSAGDVVRLWQAPVIAR